MKEIIYFGETFWESIIADTYTIGTLLIAVWFNYTFCGNNIGCNLIIIVVFFAGVMSKNKTKRFYSYDDLIKYLEKKKATEINKREEK